MSVSDYLPVSHIRPQRPDRFASLEKGGAVADQLDDLYTYLTSRLLDVALKNDVTAIEEARKLLTPIRDAWSQLSAPSLSQAVGAP